MYIKKGNRKYKARKGETQAQADTRRHQLSRKIYISFYGDISKGKIIHHIDKNSENNEKDNLVEVSRKTHKILHDKRYYGRDLSLRDKVLIRIERNLLTKIKREKEEVFSLSVYL